MLATVAPGSQREHSASPVNGPKSIPKLYDVATGNCSGQRRLKWFNAIVMAPSHAPCSRSRLNLFQVEPILSRQTSAPAASVSIADMLAMGPSFRRLSGRTAPKNGLSDADATSSIEV